MAGRRGIIVGYVIFYKKVKSVAISRIKFINNATQFQTVLRRLSRSSRYNISVAGRTKVGIGIRSKLITSLTGPFGMHCFIILIT